MGLSPEDLAVREIDVISIRDDPIAPEKYKPEEDPSTYHSEKTGRGPLAADWVSTSAPLMCCYKICRVNVAVRRPLLEPASPLDRSNCQDLSSHARAMITNALWHLLGAVTVVGNPNSRRGLGAQWSARLDGSRTSPGYVCSFVYVLPLVRAAA